MAAITKSDIVSLAFTRNVSEDHILDADVSVAIAQYVDAYIIGVTSTSTIYDDYVKPVIAFGVAVNIFNRIASEITDRGVVAMVSEGATVLDSDSKQRTLNEYADTLNSLIAKMIEAADDQGMDLRTEWTAEDFEPVGYTGTAKYGRL